MWADLRRSWVFTHFRNTIHDFLQDNVGGTVKVRCEDKVLLRIFDCLANTGRDPKTTLHGLMEQVHVEPPTEAPVGAPWEFDTEQWRAAVVENLAREPRVCTSGTNSGTGSRKSSGGGKGAVFTAECNSIRQCAAQAVAHDPASSHTPGAFGAARMHCMDWDAVRVRCVWCLRSGHVPCCMCS